MASCRLLFARLELISTTGAGHGKPNETDLKPSSRVIFSILHVRQAANRNRKFQVLNGSSDSLSAVRSRFSTKSAPPSQVTCPAGALFPQPTLQPKGITQ